MKARTLGTEQGRCKALHTYHNCPDRLKSRPAFTTLMPEKGEDAAWRLGVSTRCGAYTHSQVGCRKLAQECSEMVPGGGLVGDDTSQPSTGVPQ